MWDQRGGGCLQQKGKQNIVFIFIRDKGEPRIECLNVEQHVRTGARVNMGEINTKDLLKFVRKTTTVNAPTIYTHIKDTQMDLT